MTSRTAPQAPTDDRRVLKCSTSADFLAALPQLTGFTAQDSIFVVLFSGKRAEQAMRFDLPDEEDPRAAMELLDAMSGLVREAATALGDLRPAVVLTSSRSFAECGGAPSRAFARQLKRRLTREGFELRELCCVAADAWVSLLDPRAPLRGRPLSEISSSPIGLEAAVHGYDAPDLAEIGRLPEPDPALAAEVAKLLGRLPLPGPAPRIPHSGPGTSFSKGPLPTVDAEAAAEIREMFPGVDDPADVEAMARIIEAALLAEDVVAHAGASDQVEVPPAEQVSPQSSSEHASSPSPSPTPSLPPSPSPMSAPSPSPALLAELIVLAQDPQRWAVIALTLATRPWFPCSLATDFGPASFFFAPIERGSAPGPAPGGEQPPTRFSISRIIASLGSDDRARARVQAVLPTLSLAITVAPEHSRPALFALRAWTWWMQGLHSPASDDLERALAQHPEHPVALMMRRIVRTGPVTRLR